MTAFWRWPLIGLWIVAVACTLMFACSASRAGVGPGAASRPLREESVGDAALKEMSRGLRSFDANLQRAALTKARDLAAAMIKAKDLQGLARIAAVSADDLVAITKDGNYAEQSYRRAVALLSYLAPVCPTVSPFLDFALDDKMDHPPEGPSALAILSLGDDAVDMLVAALMNRDPNVRVNAARYLGAAQCNRKVVLDALTTALGDDDEEVKGYTAFAIGEIVYWKGVAEANIPSVVSKLVEMVEHGKTFVAVIGAELALGDIGPAARDAIPALTRRIGPKSVDIEAGYALARIDPNSPAGLSHLRNLLNGPDDMIAFSTCILAGRLGTAGRSLAPDIEKSIKADNDYVRAVKRRVLLQITGGAKQTGGAAEKGKSKR